MIARTVAELVAVLKTLDQSARVLTVAPPFDGIKLVEHDSGSILICPPKEQERGGG